MLFFITFIKFMFICVWKRMRDMNDDLIVRVIANWTLFISIWVPTTGFSNKKGSPHENYCTGTYNDHSRIMNSERAPETLPQPYSPIFWLPWTSILIFMVAILIERHKNYVELTKSHIPIIKISSPIQRPEDFENMLLNFTLLILIAVNLMGYYFHWMK